MIKVNIVKNMLGFLEVVNKCSGEVNLLYRDGRKENINKRYNRQAELLQSYRNNKDYLQLSLDIPVPGDYFSLVLFTIGEC